MPSPPPGMRSAALYPDARDRDPRPVPAGAPVEPATARIDEDLRDLAALRGWWYISPIADDWITTANYLEVIDTGLGRDHPSTEGHAYLAERLAESLDALAEATDVVADAPHRRGPRRTLTADGTPAARMVISIGTPP